jgi:hypothetical protein
VIDPRLRDLSTIAALQAAWRSAGALRVERFLDDATARAAHDDLLRLPHVVELGDASLRWRCAYAPEPACEHLLCALGRCLLHEAREWVSVVTGLELAPPPDGLVTATLHEKGCYRDLRDEGGHGDAVAFVLGLTLEPWPPEQGGHLELVDGATGAVRERRPPGWNTLDLFDVRAPGAWQQVTLLREHREGRAIEGCYPPSA